MNSPDPEPEPSTAESGSLPVSARCRNWLLMKPRDQVIGAGLLVVLLVLMIVKWATLSGWGSTPVEITELPAVRNRFRLDVNSATATEWSQLDGIGEVLAARIVEDRNTNGPFGSIDAVSRVEGIGRQTLEQIRPWLTIKQSPSNKTSTTQD